MNNIRIAVSIEKCNYCGKLNVLINDYGECTNRCPGMFTNIKPKHFVDIDQVTFDNLLYDFNKGQNK